jgi:regulator of sirC expression with transglutaminase-like and TPR domain
MGTGYARRMTPAERLARWKAVVDRPAAEIELDTAALSLGDWDGDVDVAGGRAELDRIAALVLAATAPGADRADAMAATLFERLGFAGNTVEYFDPRNSFLGEVLARRTGIPITLSVVYLEVARRVGLPAHGVGFPGHFLVRIDRGVIDPFNGGIVLETPDLERLLEQTSGKDARLAEPHLATVTTPQILARMLLNLAGVYGRLGDLFRSLEVLERLALIDRDNPRLARDLEQLRARVGDLN